MKAASVSVESASIPKALEAEEPVVLRHQDTRGVVTLTLNRPQAFNALSEVVLAALQRDLDVIAKDESVRVIVLAAEGKAFCAGHDLKEMRKKPSLDYYERLFAQCSQMMLSVQRLPVPGNTLKKELCVPGRRELFRFVQGKNARIGFNEPFSR